MATETLAVPPLPVLEFWRRKGKRVSPSTGPRIFPRALEEELKKIAQDAVRAGIDPVLASAAEPSEARTQAVLDESFRAFVRERNRIWPPVLRHMKENWLVIFPLLRGVSTLVQMERLKVPVPEVEDGSPGARALLRFGLALRTYELTLQLTLGSMSRLVVELSTGKAPKALADPKHLLALLDRIDTATAALDFGTIAAILLIERPGAVHAPVFERVTEFAARGADEQHTLLRGTLRSVIREGPVEASEEHPGCLGGADEPAAALLSDWVKAVLAA